MTRLAALIALATLAATPAAAACRSIPEAIPAIQALAGPEAVVRPLPRWIAAAVLGWVQSSGSPQAQADGFVAAVAPRGLLLFPTRAGEVCDGEAYLVTVEDTPDFLAAVREWMERRGFSKERSA